MKKIRIIAGITWAFIGLFLIIIFFPFFNTFSSSVAKLPFMKINPNYTGGEIAQTFVMESCTLVIRKPVFDGLLRERKNGFVQIDWRGIVNEEIADTIDYDFDSKRDFIIHVNVKNSKTDLEPLNNKVTGVNVSTSTSYGWAVRVNLKK
jgi:hypothetical protein